MSSRNYQKVQTTVDEEDIVHVADDLQYGIAKSTSISNKLSVETRTVSIARVYLLEVYELLKVGWPLVLTFVLHSSFSLISVFFVGHLGTEYLAATALATSIFNITGVSIIYGMAGALDTYASQKFGHLRAAYESSNMIPRGTGTIKALSQDVKYQKKLLSLGTHFYRALLIVWISVMPIMVLWTFSGPILKALGQPEILVQLTSFYLKRMIPVLPFLATYETLKRFWVSVERSDGPMLWMTIGSIACFISNYIWVTKENAENSWQFAPYALSSGYFFALLASVIHTLFTPSIFNSLQKPSRDCLKHWIQYLKLSLPSTIMICAEWWAFEICSLVAGSLGTVSMAAHSIVQTTTYSAYMLPYGLTGVAAVRVGTYLGAGDAKGAKRSALSSMIFISGVMLINAVGLLALRKQITSWYMDDEGVGSEKLTQAEEFEKVSHINEILFGIASVFQVFDGAQNCGQAILRGAGKVKMGALLTLMSYYFICLPIGIPLAFYGPTIEPIVSEKGSGVVGLWIGIGVATIFLGITMTWYVLRINWDTESRLASERIRLESPIEETTADLLEQTTDSEDQIELEVLN